MIGVKVVYRDLQRRGLKLYKDGGDVKESSACMW